MPNLDSFIPDSLRGLAARSGTEWLYPRDAIIEVVQIAYERQIAILGVEAFLILTNGFQTEAISDYDVPFNGNWEDFVRKNNTLALEFVQKNEDHGRNSGYILTSVSEDEYLNLAATAGRRSTR